MPCGADGIRAQRVFLRPKVSMGAGLKPRPQDAMADSDCGLLSAAQDQTASSERPGYCEGDEVGAGGRR